MIAKDTAAKNRTDIIRAGATYPSAVPASYFQVSSSLQHPHPGTTATASKKCFPPNTRPRPAFGATRYEGAAGPVAGLSHPYADTPAIHCRRRGQSAAYSKRCAGNVVSFLGIGFVNRKIGKSDNRLSSSRRRWCRWN